MDRVNNVSWGSFVNIVFGTTQLKKACNSDKQMGKKWGTNGAKRLRRRLDDLRAAPNLEAMRRLPGRCHELTGNRSGQLSIDLVHPLRLILEPVGNPAPRKADGGLDWEAVTAIRVVGVLDTHA